MTRRFQFSVERLWLAVPMVMVAAALSALLPIGKRHPMLGWSLMAGIVLLVLGAGAVILRRPGILWLTLVVAAFFAGAAWEHQRERPASRRFVLTPSGVGEKMTMPNGDEGFRAHVRPEEAKRYFDETVAPEKNTSR